jgi:hypothetical protein
MTEVKEVVLPEKAKKLIGIVESALHYYRIERYPKGDASPWNTCLSTVFFQERGSVSLEVLPEKIEEVHRFLGSFARSLVYDLAQIHKIKLVQMEGHNLPIPAPDNAQPSKLAANVIPKLTHIQDRKYLYIALVLERVKDHLIPDAEGVVADVNWLRKASWDEILPDVPFHIRIGPIRDLGIQSR